jgi:hypothetical protein
MKGQIFYIIKGAGNSAQICDSDLENDIKLDPFSN